MIRCGDDAFGRIKDFVLATLPNLNLEEKAFVKTGLSLWLNSPEFLCAKTMKSVKRIFFSLLIAVMAFFSGHSIRTQTDSRAYTNDPYDELRTQQFWQNFHERMAELETISRLNPDSAEAQCEYAKAYLKTSQGAEKAIELFERAIELKPDFAEAYNGLGWAYLDTWGIRAAMRPPLRKNCTAAIEFFEKAVSLNPDYFDSYLGLGLCYNRLDRNKEALPYLEKAVQLKPDDGNAWTYLMLVYEALNRYEEAIEAQKRDIQTGSNDEMTIEKLYTRNDPGRGKDRYFDMLDLARLYEKNGQIDEAVTCYEQAKTIEPFDPIAYHHLALTLFAAGQREAAFVQYNLLLSLCQSTDDQVICQHSIDDLADRMQ